MQPEDLVTLENQYWRRIVHNLPHDHTSEDYHRLLEEELAHCRDPITDAPATPDEIVRIRQRISIRIEYESQYSVVEILDPAQIRNPEGHIDWYPEWLEGNPDRYHWMRHYEHLVRSFLHKYPDDPGRSARIIGTINNDTDRILELMENPNRVRFNSKGLVVGYVQSGKTANFTALIAKALDAGYKFVIIFTGIHNVLRYQTQERVDRELTGEEEDAIQPPDAFHSIIRLTSPDLDFSPNNINQRPLSTVVRGGFPIISIMKKRPDILERLIFWVSTAPEDIRRNIPLLVIDDEADLASIDTHANMDDEEPSTTNEKIRRLLFLFPRHSYIGYTATPFANVLIDMAVHHEDLGRDLYPRNFIVSLNRPQGYIGALEVFRSNLRDMYVHPVDQLEADQLIAHPGRMTPTLESAIMGHFLACAVRCFRGDGNEPMSMLIHISRTKDGHELTKNIVEELIESLKSNLRNPHERPLILETFEEIWNTNYLPSINTHFPNRLLNFEDITPYIENVLNSTEILKINSDREADELDFANHPRVIVIGGNKLSRGLTLNGLLTSFYLRASRQYDTLLQMGRWFGFRENYEDLTKIYTTDILASFFEELAIIEQELREEILQYESEDITPLDVSVRIRTNRHMRVTARNKMGAGHVVPGSYSKRLVQTIWFPLHKAEILRQNLNTGSLFIRDHEWAPVGPSYLSMDIPSTEILEFLDQYRFATREDIPEFGSSLDPDELKQYIRLENGNRRLLEWNVAVVGLDEGDERTNWEGLNIFPVTRSRLSSNVYRYKIGALSDPNHLKLDYPDLEDPYDRREKPLLLFYRVSRESTARAPSDLTNRRRNRRNQTEDLFAGIPERVDVLGLVMVFPHSRTMRDNFISQ
jgi:hypothetical protein